MMDGTPSADDCGWLHQLQICKLLQHKDMVVCPEGLNGKLEALQFTFQELPLWDAATPSKPTHEPQLTEVEPGSVQPESMTSAIQAPTNTLVLPPLWSILLSLPMTSPDPSTYSSRGPWSGCSRLPPTALAPVSWCSMSRREPPSVALGILPQPEKQKIPSGQRGQTPSALPNCNPMQMSLWPATPGGTPCFTHITHPLLQPTVPKILEVASMCMFPQGCTCWAVR